jgi:RNA polymerase sigma-70 factor, ECF subfamily
MAGKTAITLLLRRASEGDADAQDSLYTAVYAELRQLAGWLLRRERAGHTLQATALVHEAYLRLITQTVTNWRDRAHFFHVAASVMRNILRDYARQHRALKRAGPQVEHVELDASLTVSDDRWDSLLSLDEALNRLSKLDERQARIVVMRYYCGMTEEEVGLVLGLSSRTVKRDWCVAKAWLKAELAGPKRQS